MSLAEKINDIFQNFANSSGNHTPRQNLEGLCELLWVLCADQDGDQDRPHLEFADAVAWQIRALAGAAGATIRDGAI